MIFWNCYDIVNLLKARRFVLVERNLVEVSLLSLLQYSVAPLAKHLLNLNRRFANEL